VLAYTVTTQSTTKTLDMVAASTEASDIAAFNTGLTAQNLLPSTVPNADQTDVYVGTLKVPYYGDVPSEAAPKATLSSFWRADVAKPDAKASFLGKAGACGAYAAKLTVNGVALEPSASTTTCFPMPVKQSDQTIPMLVTVPKGIKPEGGWPVVIFQHGITRNRADMLAIAPALASAKFVTVAIDLPLHGIAPTDAAKGLRINGVSERTFDVDFVNNTTNAKVPDGVIDGSGTHFINLESPITSRDNLRQGAADILVLAKSLPNLNLDGVAGGDINASKIRFVGISLGSIVGTVALGADNGKTIGAASLSVGGGAIPKLLDASKSYGPIITAGLAASGVAENTDSYETFMRFAQTLTDSGDPINFAVAAKTNHPLHLTEVVGDLVVPNSAMAGAASATQDFVGISAFLSGTDALARVMGVDQTIAALDITGIAASQKVSPTGLGVLVKFKQGSHGSLIDPSSNLAVTQEMQRQTVNFIATNGVCLPIGQNCAF
jgi:pimeloyl-ACP methyl ester carboxylesterase